MKWTVNVTLVALIMGCSGEYVYLKSSTNPRLLQKHLEALIQDDSYRNYQNPDELNRVADYIGTEIGKNDFECRFQHFEVDGLSYQNVVCEMLSGFDDMFVVGAHYDVCGQQKGADDNASGVAGLIELSRLLYQQRETLRTGIQLVAYSLEEPPFFGTENMGSYFHAKSLFESSKKIRGMIALEMIGYFSDEDIQEYPAFLSLFYPSEANFIAAVSNYGSGWISDLYESAMEDNTDMEVKKLSSPGFVEGVDFSDHRNYWSFDYDAIMITDTAFFRNKNYHRPTDTIDTLDFTKMGKVVDGVAILLCSLEK